MSAWFANVDWSEIGQACLDTLAMLGGSLALTVFFGLPLGVLPMGPANDLARTLGVPTDLDAAARVIAEGHTRRIDLGLVNREPFFNVASIGLSAELAQELTREIKRRFGGLGYGLVAL